MYKTGILFIALVFGVVSISNAQTKQKMKEQQTIQKTATKMENDFDREEKKVFGTIEKMVTSFQNKDIEGILATYEADAVVMFEPQRPVSGKDRLRKAFTEFVGIDPQYNFSGHEIYISGNIATHIAPWSMVGHLPDGSRIEQSGLSIAVLRKQEDGTWLMVQDNPHGQHLMSR